MVGEAVLDLCAPLPGARLVVEASAGTGKTFALTSMATRLIVEDGLAPAELLVVTFTRAATAELRSRLRDRLSAALSHLSASAQPSTDDLLLQHLWLDDDAQRGLRVRRLRRALAEFDAATITTIHGFAAQVLAATGISQRGLGAIVDDLATKSKEVCADVLAAASLEVPSADALPSYTTLLGATRTVMNSPDLLVVPAAGEPGATDDELRKAELVRRSVAELRRRRLIERSVGFDDLIGLLRDALEGPRRGSFVELLRRRFRVALIDEFQDTDPAQWAVFEAVFGADPAVPMVLVGDPKQAIYSFRGANVHTYLAAIAPMPGTSQASLVVNWRSDGAMLRALDLLFRGATFGDERIRFTSVEPAPANRDATIRDTSGTPLPALVIRCALDQSIQRTSRNKVAVDDAGRAIAVDLAQQVHRLLDGATIPLRERDGETRRRVRPSDVAVLVRTRAEAEDFQQALLRQGIPAVLARGTSVLESPAAEQWRTLLVALTRPSNPRTARAFALSWFVGWNGDDLARCGDAELAELQQRLAGWAETLAADGVASFVRQVWADGRVAARVLAQPDGDRSLTDLEHVGELLQMSGGLRHPGPAALLKALEVDPLAREEGEEHVDLSARRIESDADAVQVMTIWVSKGLQFPIVCVPSLWRKPKSTSGISTDPDTGERILDVTSTKASWPDRATAKERRARAAAEALGEQLRLAYVALTRAQHQTLLWWSNGSQSEQTSLAHLLFARGDSGDIDPELWAAQKVHLPSDDSTPSWLRHALGDRSDGTIAIEFQPECVPTAGWVDPAAPPAAETLDPAVGPAALDRTARRWSFTMVARYLDVDLAMPHVGPDHHRDAGAADEVEAEVAAIDQSRSTIPGPYADLPAGTAFGTLLHTVLEHLDFTGPDLAAQAGALGRSFDRGQMVLLAGDTERFGAAVEATLRTPLGPSFGDLTLAGLSRQDRLDEMTFDFRLAGGSAAATVAEIAELVALFLPEDDPLLPWATAVAAGTWVPDLSGHLTGAIDLVLRRRDPDGTTRFVVCDYKTNQLPGYGREQLAAAMAAHHYPLQALLYEVALHRYLRWRLVDYEPALHLGGVAYLFVRGMAGEATPADGQDVEGVFRWIVPSELVVALSDLLDGRHHRSQAPSPRRGSRP